MNFLGEIFSRAGSDDCTILIEPRPSSSFSVNGPELLRLVSQAQAFLRSKKLAKGDRVALLAANSIDWVAVDLAIMAEGLIVVPLYSRQAPDELVTMMRDCSPALICCGDASL